MTDTVDAGGGRLRTVTYSAKLEHYLVLCRSCHTLLDQRRPDKCRNGHEYTPENTRWQKRSYTFTHRVCRTCAREALERLAERRA